MIGCKSRHNSTQLIWQANKLTRMVLAVASEGCWLASSLQVPHGVAEFSLVLALDDYEPQMLQMWSGPPKMHFATVGMTTIHSASWDPRAGMWKPAGIFTTMTMTLTLSACSFFGATTNVHGAMWCSPGDLAPIHRHEADGALKTPSMIHHRMHVVGAGATGPARSLTDFVPLDPEAVGSIVVQQDVLIAAASGQERNRRRLMRAARCTQAVTIFTVGVRLRSGR